MPNAVTDDDELGGHRQTGDPAPMTTKSTTVVVADRPWLVLPHRKTRRTSCSASRSSGRSRSTPTSEPDPVDPVAAPCCDAPRGPPRSWSASSDGRGRPPACGAARRVHRPAAPGRAGWWQSRRRPRIRTSRAGFASPRVDRSVANPHVQHMQERSCWLPWLRRVFAQAAVALGGSADADAEPGVGNAVGDDRDDPTQPRRDMLHLSGERFLVALEPPGPAVGAFDERADEPCARSNRDSSSVSASTRCESISPVVVMWNAVIQPLGSSRACRGSRSAAVRGDPSCR